MRILQTYKILNAHEIQTLDTTRQNVIIKIKKNDGTNRCMAMAANSDGLFSSSHPCYPIQCTVVWLLPIHEIRILYCSAKLIS
jgi:hypothetical protein